MSGKKIVVVTGATGAQGGGLARAILADPAGPFAVRAITRNADSPAARELARLGAEVVRADLDDAASLEGALRGAWGAYFVTAFWEHFSPERELAQAANMAGAARATGLQHAIWSTLEDTRRWIPLGDTRMPTLMGRYKVPHFDAKGEANQRFLDAGVPTTFLLTSFYWENFLTMLAPQRAADGRLAITLPMGEALLPGIAVRDIGGCAYGILCQGSAWIGRTVGIAGEHLSAAAMASGLSRLLGEPVALNAVTPDQFRALGFPGADDLGNMFQFKRDFTADFCAARSVAVSRALHPALLDFAGWLAAAGSAGHGSAMH